MMILRFVLIASCVSAFGFIVGICLGRQLALPRIDLSAVVLLLASFGLIIGLATRFASTKRRLVLVVVMVAMLPAYAGASSPYPKSTKMIAEEGRDLYVVSCAPLTVCTIFLAAGESPSATQPLTVGDSARWKFEVGSTAGRYFVAIKPTEANIATSLQINTDRAAHVLRLISVPFVRAITYAFPDITVRASVAMPTPTPTDKPRINADYRISGIASFRPVGQIYSDGDRTYIPMGQNAFQPTIYGIDESGQQYPIHVVPPQYQGDSMLVLDGVPQHFVMETGPGKRDARIDVVRIR